MSRHKAITLIHTMKKVNTVSPHCHVSIIVQGYLRAEFKPDIYTKFCKPYFFFTSTKADEISYKFLNSLYNYKSAQNIP